jgi:hypothetical protein
MGDTPRVMQFWLREGGEPRDIRNEICLNEVGIGTPNTCIEGADDDSCGHQEAPSCFVHDEHSSAK